MVEVEELTYEKIQQLKAEQERLVAAGIIERPPVAYGFTPEDRAEFDKGITLDDIMNRISKKQGFVW
ncbi:MAG: hypothetical protein LBB64_00525 [Dysgonamonadaceae bacterium]|jgi:hypothetical protein|nr:hypothetical protein [Dysgonamonadaceae bacterium]